MSHIPNSAMPHAGTIEDKPEETEKGRSGAFFRQNATRAADKVRAHPKAAAAAGAALVATLATAAAIPLLRKSDGRKTTGRAKAKA